MPRQVAIHGKPFTTKETPVLNRFFEQLVTCQFQPVLSWEFYEICKQAGIVNLAGFQVYQPQQNLGQMAFAFSFGGDGTLLELLTHVGQWQVPIVGINMGRLGFLATTTLSDVHQAVDNICRTKFEIDERILLEMVSNQPLFEGNNFALNDFAILKRDTSSMIKVKVLIDSIYLNTYWADGLIVATPTGSTGYSLSCGGPLVLPQSHNFVITPVSPHNLTVRPLVVSDNSELSFEIESRSENVLVSLDARSQAVPSNIQITVKKFDLTAKLVKFNNYNQFDTMRGKLNWGIDYRN